MMEVAAPGMFTTIQDRGRTGYQQYGVSPGGAVDKTAHRLANIVIGNREEAPVLEMTLQGSSLRVTEDTLFSITGADMKPEVDGNAVPMWRPVYIRKGAELHFRSAAKGLRTYVAVAGGFHAESFLGSASTYIQTESGGYEGRALDRGDTLSFCEPTRMNERMKEQLGKRAGAEAFVTVSWRAASLSLPEGEAIRIFEGRHFDLFDEESRKALTDSSYQMGTKSDRMGLRLHGSSLRLERGREIISGPVTFGTIQVPSGGQPIVLLADRQTTGGYPKMAQVASADFSRLAQKRPGETLRFTMVTHREAERLLLRQESHIAWCRQAIQAKIEEGTL